MYKVYVSSTKVDLDSERDRVITELVDARYLPFHSYRSASDPLVKSCEKDVADSDIYVLLMGRRYGHRPPLDNPEQLSITQLEFRKAVELGKPLVLLEQGNPPMDLSDADQGRDADEQSRKAFWAEVRSKGTPGRFTDTASLVKAVLNGVNEAARRLQDRQAEGAPPIAPGISPPHGRLLPHALLLLHLAGTDEELAGRLAAALGSREIRWPVLPLRWNVEEGIDWRAIDLATAGCRSAAVLLTDSASRFGADAAALRRVLGFLQRQCGFAAGLVVGDAAAAMPWLPALPLQQVHRLDTWAGGTTGALTPDLSRAARDMLTRHPDIAETRLVGLQCMVVAMTRAEARQLRDEPTLREDLNGEQRRFLDAALAHLHELGTDWLARYGDTRDAWQPFGQRDGQAFPALAVLREVVEDINGQSVMSRRDQEALRNHRIRLRPYSFDPLVAEDERVLKMLPQVLERRVLVLVDELSLCHPRLRAAVAGLLANPLLAVATVAPFDPPSQPVEAALAGNSVLQLGALKDRFLQALDPACELNLASGARLRRWLRLSIPETLSAQGGSAQEDRRLAIRSEMGLR